MEGSRRRAVSWAGGPLIEFPEKLQFLFEPARYKVAYGGRGSAKSWGFARAAIIKGAEEQKRIVCAREIQNSIGDSVHALLKTQIDALGLTGFYEVKDTYIRGANGTEFTFHGLRHNVNSIKSLEGADICWVEEAQSVSKRSWETLIPTIRKPNSEIWATFNPELETDYTYQYFVLDPPADAKVVAMNWRDNPWFPVELLRHMQEVRRKSEDDYLHIYEGQCKQVLDGAVYADEIRLAQTEGRITKLKYDQSKGVHVFVDLGWSDFTSLWFVQKVGQYYHVLHAYQNRLKKWSHYLDYIRSKGWIIAKVWLPHDARANSVAADASVWDQTVSAGVPCDMVPNIGLVDGLNAAREKFEFCQFDEKECFDGLNALKRYVWDTTAAGLSRREPKHDVNSHYADSFRYFAVGMMETIPAKPLNIAVPVQIGSWMG